MANDPRPSGRVHYVLTVGVGDGTDTGREPDEIGVNGTVTFSANVERVIVGSGATRHMILPQNISATLTNGVLQWGSPLVDDVPLTANLDSAGNRLGWQWTAQFVNLTYPDPANANTPKRVNATAYSFDVRPYDANATSDPVTGLNPTVTDLTEMAPVITGSAVQLAKGDPGDVTDLQIGTVTTGTPAATITGAAPTKFLNLVLPNAGAGAVSSVAGRTGAVTIGSADIADATTVGKSLLLAADAAALRGITGSGTYSKPGTGIPATDLSSGAQTSLGKADSSVQQTEHIKYIRRWTGTAWEIRGIVPSGSEVEWQSPISVGPPPSDGTYALGGIDYYVGE